ncbi:hypothetical protein [uncultured Ruminococcus sp.]|uniref:hypothetical protein n=1 Tax=uncultured Ruminococcus sp. TaxID=165186 RepID=UPI0025F5D059|nr:hypothetical protein [uncultured Ruminococcus sp.]
MKLKKINAVLAILSMVAMIGHIGYTDFAYLKMYYNPLLKLLTSLPFMILTCLHAVCGMSAVFMQADGTRLDLYPEQNKKTIVQRLSAALIFPLLLLHINTFDLLKSCAESGKTVCFVLLLISQPIFYGVIFAHTSVSFSRSLITVGILTSRERQKMIDRIVGIASAVLFAVTVFAVIKGQLAMFRI